MIYLTQSRREAEVAEIVAYLGHRPRPRAKGIPKNLCALRLSAPRREIYRVSDRNFNLRLDFFSAFIPNLGLDADGRRALLEVEVFCRHVCADGLEVVVVWKRQIGLRRLHNKRHIADKPALNLIEVRGVPLPALTRAVAWLVPRNRLLVEILRPAHSGVVRRNA